MSPISTPKLNKQSMYNANDRIAIKVSWKQSRSSVENECSILQRLESVPHVVRCIGQPNPYPYEDGRVMMALTPVVTSDISSDGITSSINNLKPGAAQIYAVKCIIETMIGILQSGVYTIDVQPLIDRDSGEVVFIDFTEAHRFSYPITSTDESALVGFCTEMLALIPDSLKDFSSEMLKQELRSSDELMNNPLPEKVVDVVERVWFD
jgi:hypothetical protein